MTPVAQAHSTVVLKEKPPLELTQRPVTHLASLTETEGISEGDVYIGRGSNRYNQRPTRWTYHTPPRPDQSAEDYDLQVRAHIYKTPKLYKDLHLLKGHRLVCNCPIGTICHGLTLVNMIEEATAVPDSTVAEPAPKRQKHSTNRDINYAIYGDRTPLPQGTAERVWPKPSTWRRSLLKLPLLIILILYAGPKGPESLEAAILEKAPHLSQYVVALDTKRDKF